MVRSFSLPDFVSEIQEAIRPVLNAYSKVYLRFLNRSSPPILVFVASN